MYTYKMYRAVMVSATNSPTDYCFINWIEFLHHMRVEASQGLQTTTCAQLLRVCSSTGINPSNEALERISSQSS